LVVVACMRARFAPIGRGSTQGERRTDVDAELVVAPAVK
jgi:hypothetical protein